MEAFKTQIVGLSSACLDNLHGEIVQSRSSRALLSYVDLDKLISRTLLCGRSLFVKTKQ